MKTFPLSLAQQRLWIFAQLEPTNPVYNITITRKLNGSLNIDVLEQAINEIINRHEVLRTYFPNSHSQPVQIILPKLTIKITTIDLKQIPETQQIAETTTITSKEAQTPFDISEVPLLRVVLLELDEKKNILLFVIHHIIYDGWSNEVFFKELEHLYEAFLRKESPSLPNLPIQYVDYAVWQQEMLKEAFLEEQLDYWKMQLADCQPLIKLPTDRPRPSIQTYKGDKISLALPTELTSQLRLFSKKQGVTLFMTLLAAFNTLLYRYTNQEDMVVSSPIACRNRAEIEGLIGFFVNTLILRVKVLGTLSFIELLARTKKICLEAYIHQDVPFDKLVEVLRPERDPSYSPFFQIAFALQHTIGIELKLTNLEMLYLPVKSKTTKFDLALEVLEQEQNLTLVFEYNCALFELSTIERTLHHFQRLLESITKEPSQKISWLPFLTEIEKETLLSTFNNTIADYPQNLSVHQLFQEQVDLTPNKIAVVQDTVALTYKELNESSNQLAHYLETIGVLPEMLIGVCLNRSPKMVIALLAILKVGATYIPFDPTYPTERHNIMAEKSNLKMIISESYLSNMLEKLSLGSIIKKIYLDTDETIICQYSKDNLKNKIHKENLAYTLFTSGSTGKPKGVQISHKALVNLLWSMRKKPGISKDDILLAITSLSFDIAGLEIYLPLITGAKLILADQSTTTDGKALLKLIKNHNVSILQATPSTWRLLLDSQWIDERFKILCGGEALDITIAKELCTRSSSVWNVYGPTETTIWSTVCQITLQNDSISIGCAINNTQTYILDPNLQPVPIGVTGTLYIGGDGLARGYLNEPSLTAEKFIPNPFVKQYGSRLYNTGDLARYLINGDIEFLGRQDNQIKIRGFRIELGEIESLLNQYPFINQSVVLLQEDELQNKYLAAYLTVKQGHKVKINEIKQYLKNLLPVYMLPSFYLEMEIFPLTPNKKLDRKAFPKPQLNGSKDFFHKEITPTEEILMTIWKKVLQIDSIDLYDNFFDLGGHSLLFIQINSRIKKVFDVEMSINAFFDTPTIKELAKHIDTFKFSQIETLKLEKQKSYNQLNLSFAQKRLWFLNQLEPDNTTYTITKAYKLIGPLDVVALEKSINEIIKRHESLRTNFVTKENQPFQIVRKALLLSLEIKTIQNLKEQEKQNEISSQIKILTKAFDLSNEPLVRIRVIKTKETEHVLLLAMHHIISDGLSIEIFQKELELFYKATINNQETQLEPLIIQYADYAVWQHEFIKSQPILKQIDYWKEKLQGIPPLLEILGSNPRPKTQSYNGALQYFELSTELKEKLTQLSRKENITLFMLLLAAFKVILLKFTQKEDILVATDIANRSFETENLIGLFVNQLMLRTNLKGNPTFLELLNKIRDVTLEAYANKELPFDKLLEIVKPLRNPSYNPIFQIMFILQNSFFSELKLEGIEIIKISTETQTSPFDLSVHLEQNSKTIRGVFRYNKELFNTNIIASLVDYYEKLLNNIIYHNDKSLMDLIKLTDQSLSNQHLEKQISQRQNNLEKLKTLKNKPLMGKAK